MRYAAAGVDIDAQDRTLELIKPAVRATYTDAVVTDLGSFGGIFALDPARYPEPLLVSSIDSVGTKVKVAARCRSWRGVGVDLVHHCVNDIAVMGAEPLFFLDYYGTGKLVPEAAAEAIGGLADACRGVGCVLIGGELAELPGMYPEGDFDLVGCIVGVVGRERVLTGASVADGDVVLGLPSSGLHTNGYSLARKVLFEMAGYEPETVVDPLDRPLGEVLLEPHRCYLSEIRLLHDAGLLKAAAHITGGGIVDNLPRVLPEGLGARLDRRRWPVPPIFDLIRQQGDVDDADMLRTFNLGLGMLLIVAEPDADAALRRLEDAGSPARQVGRVVKDVEGVDVGGSES